MWVCVCVCMYFMTFPIWFLYSIIFIFYITLLEQQKNFIRPIEWINILIAYIIFSFFTIKINIKSSVCVCMYFMTFPIWFLYSIIFIFYITLLEQQKNFIRPIEWINILIAYIIFSFFTIKINIKSSTINRIIDFYV